MPLPNYRGVVWHASTFFEKKSMNNQDLLRQAFARSLNVPLETITDNLAYNTIREWDSVAHMVLVVEIESTFNIMFDTDDIIDMSSFAKAVEIVAKYGVAC